MLEQKPPPALKKVEKNLRRDFALIALIGAVIFIASSAFFISEANRLIQEKRVEQLTSVADNFSRVIVEDWLTMNLARIEEKSHELILNNNLNNVVVARLNGDVLVRAEKVDGEVRIDYRAQKLNISMERNVVQDKNDVAKIQKTFQVGNTHLGVLQITAQGNAFEPIIIQLVFRLGVTLGALVLIGGFVFVLVIDRLTKTVILTLTSIHKDGRIDKLTKLPNRNAIYDYISGKLLVESAYGGTFMVCFIDVNDLKKVNDKYGHNAGDLLIQQVAVRLKSVLRGRDFLGRLAGDEFVAVLDCTSRDRNLEKVFERMLVAVNQALPVENMTIFPSCSIGAVISSVEIKDAEELINLADKAMYKAKKMNRQSGAFVIHKGA